MTPPFAVSENRSAPVVTLTPGSPNRLWSAGARKTMECPWVAAVMEPSACTVNLPGPDKFKVMVFPVLGFVSEALKGVHSRVWLTYEGWALSGGGLAIERAGLTGCGRLGVAAMMACA